MAQVSRVEAGPDRHGGRVRISAAHSSGLIQDRRDALAAWNNRPLCRQYLAIFLRCQSFSAVENLSAAGGALWWGFGLLEDGEMEILGAWLRTAEQFCDLREPLITLHARGVERVRLIQIARTKVSPFGVSGCNAGLKPRGAVVPLHMASASACTAGRPWLARARKRNASLVSAAVAEMEVLDARLAFDVSRHGVFASPNDVVPFFAAKLLKVAGQNLAMTTADQAGMPQASVKTGESYVTNAAHQADHEL